MSLDVGQCDNFRSYSNLLQQTSFPETESIRMCISRIRNDRIQGVQAALVHSPESEKRFLAFQSATHDEKYALIRRRSRVYPR